MDFSDKIFTGGKCTQSDAHIEILTLIETHECLQQLYQLIKPTFPGSWGPNSGPDWTPFYRKITVFFAVDLNGVK